MTSLLSVSLLRSRFLDVTQRSFAQWNPINTDSEETCHSIRIIRVSEKKLGLRKKVTNTYLLDKKTKADSVTRKPCLFSELKSETLTSSS